MEPQDTLQVSKEGKQPIDVMPMNQHNNQHGKIALKLN